jgi:hypothetical protein
MRLRVVDLRRRTEQMLNLDGMNWGAAWHRGRNQLAFSSIRKGDIDAYVKDLDTDRPEHAAIVGTEDSSVVAWTGENQLLTRSSESTGAYRLVLRNVDAGGGPERVVTEAGVLPGASLSPDGRWVAYSAARGGPREILVAPFEGQGAARIVSRAGGMQPVFGRRLGELFYRRGRQLVRVPWRAPQSTFTAGPERIVAELDFGSLPGYPAPFDAAADGRVLALVRLSPPPHPRIVVVVQWAQELSKPGE